MTPRCLRSQDNKLSRRDANGFGQASTEAMTTARTDALPSWSWIPKTGCTSTVQSCMLGEPKSLASNASECHHSWVDPGFRALRSAQGHASRYCSAILLRTTSRDAAHPRTGCIPVRPQPFMPPCRRPTADYNYGKSPTEHTDDVLHEHQSPLLEAIASHLSRPGYPQAYRRTKRIIPVLLTWTGGQ